MSYLQKTFRYTFGFSLLQYTYSAIFKSPAHPLPAAWENLFSFGGLDYPLLFILAVIPYTLIMAAAVAIMYAALQQLEEIVRKNDYQNPAAWVKFSAPALCSTLGFIVLITSSNLEFSGLYELLALSTDIFGENFAWVLVIWALIAQLMRVINYLRSKKSRRLARISDPT